MNTAEGREMTPEELAADETETMRRLVAMARRAAVHLTTRAHADDPARMAGLSRELDFDGGKAYPSIVVAFYTNGRAIVSHRLSGTRDGEEVVAEVGAVAIQGAVPAATAH